MVSAARRRAGRPAVPQSELAASGVSLPSRRIRANVRAGGRRGRRTETSEVGAASVAAVERSSGARMLRGPCRRHELLREDGSNGALPRAAGTGVYGDRLQAQQFGEQGCQAGAVQGGRAGVKLHAVGRRELLHESASEEQQDVRRHDVEEQQLGIRAPPGGDA